MLFILMREFFFVKVFQRHLDMILSERKVIMPSNAKFLTATLREKCKRGFQEPEEAVNEAADPTYFGAALPYLGNEALNVVNTAPLTGIFALNTGDLHGSSPQVFISEFNANSGFYDQTTTQLWPDSKKSPQNAQAFHAAQSLGTSDNVVMGDRLDLDPDLEVCELTYLFYIYLLLTFIEFIRHRLPKSSSRENTDLVSDKAKGPSLSTICRSVLGLMKKARALQSVMKLTQLLTRFFQVSLPFHFIVSCP